MKKIVEMDMNIDIARKMLRVAGFDEVPKMTDDEVFEKVLELSDCYGMSYSLNTNLIQENAQDAVTQIKRLLSAHTDFSQDTPQVNYELLIALFKILDIQRDNVKFDNPEFLEKFNILSKKEATENKEEMER